jgi:hypothetical protein
MSAVVPSTAWQPHPASREPVARSDPRIRRRSRSLLPLTVICAAQTALSLTLVWSNTAYIDEANYLWAGHLEIAHWLHGTSWPSVYAEKLFSGSPLIYPPLGALADSIGGLALARILSLVFMLFATVLLYFTALELIGRRGAIISSGLWVLSEPTIRLAFATYDPLSIALTAFSAWLIVQTRYRRYRGAFVSAAAVALAVANFTAYSGIVIDPVVIAFAFLTWLPCIGAPRTALYTIWLAGGWAALFGLLIASTHSWSGLLYTVVARNVVDYQGITPVLNDIWGYSGLILVLTIAGSILAYNTESRSRAGMLVLLGSAAFIVPAAQLHDQTAWSLDKHLAYGIWFAVIVIGYWCDQLIRWLPQNSRRLAAICGIIGIFFVGINSWQSAWDRYHAWPNASSFIANFKIAVTQSRGLIYVPGQEANIAQYYTKQGQDWTRWTAALQLNPAAVPQPALSSYYSSQLEGGNYGLVVLFYSTTFSSAPQLSSELLLSPPGVTTNRELLGLVGESSGESGLSALTLALENDPDYRRVAVGPYNSAHEYGIYAIWLKVGT